MRSPARESRLPPFPRVPSEFITPRLRRRGSDIIWRLRWGKDRWLYVYLLLEFQSTVDPYMALRVMVYVGLLCADRRL